MIAVNQRLYTDSERTIFPDWITHPTQPQQNKSRLRVAGRRRTAPHSRSHGCNTGTARSWYSFDQWRSERQNADVTTAFSAASVSIRDVPTAAFTALLSTMLYCTLVVPGQLHPSIVQCAHAAPLLVTILNKSSTRLAALYKTFLQFLV